MKKSNNNTMAAAAFAALLISGIAGGCSASETTTASAPQTPTAAGVGTGLSGLGAGPSPVSLGTAGNFVIVAKTAVSTTAGSTITGNIGISPAAATFITGFSLVADGSGVFSTSALVTGNIYASNYTPPTPTTMSTAVSDMETAFTDAASRTADYTELAAGDISGKNLGPAAYKWGTGVVINSNLTLTGGPNDVWIFEIAQGLTVANGVQIVLAGGALAKNIFWQASATVTIGTGAQMVGVILGQTAINLNTGASATSRLLAQSQVTLDANVVTKPAP